VEKVKYKMQPVLFRRDLQIYDCLKFKDTYKDCPQKGLLVVWNVHKMRHEECKSGSMLCEP